MKKERRRAVLRDVLKKNRIALLLLLLLVAFDLTVFLLYGLDPEPFIYAALLTGFFGAVFFAADLIREMRRAETWAEAAVRIPTDPFSLPEPETLAETDLKDMVECLGRETERLKGEAAQQRQDMLDYYVSWIHQIKTPIAVMKLRLTEDTEENRALRAELFRIEQYVDMVLQYVRLGEGISDLVVREYDLDELVKSSLHKYAPQFILKKLRLDYEPANVRIVTDKKWFSCILDQLLYNAVKYTAKGSVGIRYEDGLLKIRDTGLGIAPEDLPRIFEKGYTGGNGRIGQNSSGLGLYLAGKAAALLSIPLSAESKVGEGSCFIMDLRQPEIRHD